MSGADLEVQITFVVPPAGDQPSKFRRALIESIRNAIATTAMAGTLDPARAEEAFRVLPVEARK